MKLSNLIKKFFAEDVEGANVVTPAVEATNAIQKEIPIPAAKPEQISTDEPNNAGVWYNEI